MKKIGVADTMFARVDMAAEALAVIEAKEENFKVSRYTVPGMKDLPVAAKRLLNDGCDIVLAFGWVGKEPVDEQCAHEANLGLIWVEIEAATHILKVFFHESETSDPQRQAEIALHRARKHTENAILMLKGPAALTPRAGKGCRQGYEDAGKIEVRE